jgi:small subunit ribosomal protein S19e
VVGVERLRTRYGGRKQRGQRPPEFRKGGGKIIRTILQQAESAGFLEKVKEKRSGRKLTVKGREFMEEVK